MAEPEIIRIGCGVPIEISRWPAAADANPRDGQGTNTPSVALLDSRQVYLTQAKVPSRRRKTALAAIPYAVEEELAAEVESLHFSIGPRRIDRNYPVAILCAKLLSDLCDHLDRHGLYPQGLFPDVLALPWHEETWSLLQIDDAVLVRTGHCQGFACDAIAAQAVLDASLQPPPPRLIVYGPPGSFDFLDWARGNALVVETAMQTQAPLGILARGIEIRDLPDLLPASRRRYPAQTGFRWLRVAVSLSLIWATLSIVNDGLDLRRTQNGARLLNDKMVATLLDVAPPDTPVIEPLRQLTDLLAERRNQRSGRGGLLKLLHAIAAIEQPGGQLPLGESVTLSRIEFQGHRLELTVQAKSAGNLEQLVRQLGAKSGHRAQIMATTAVDDITEGKLLIELGPI